VATVNETTRAESWLYQALAAGVPSLQAYSVVAPEGAAQPFIVFQQQATSDLMVVGAARVWASMLYLVKVVGQTTSFTALQPAADLVDAALHAAAGQVGGGTILACTRERAFSLVEESNGLQWRHLGGVFRLLVQGQ